jgi:hypothetical protein
MLAAIVLAVALASGFLAAPRGAGAFQAAEGIVPHSSAELFRFLQAGGYREFAGETEVHPSNGPHGRVRTFLNPILEESLEAGNEVHPVNAAAVKELYNGSGRLIGWAVSVKVQAESEEGDGWYWYENFSTTQNRPIADGKGVGLCAGCHSGGHDFVTVPYPLQ